MKKITSILVLLSILVISVLPLVVSAQTQAPSCCRLGNAIKIFDSGANIERSFSAGTIVGETGGYCPAGTPSADSANVWGVVCTLNTMLNITNVIFVVLLTVAVVVGIIGAFIILTSAGTPERVTSGRNYIIYAIVGLLVAFVARAIPTVARTIMGV